VSDRWLWHLLRLVVFMLLDLLTAATVALAAVSGGIALTVGEAACAGPCLLSRSWCEGRSLLAQWSTWCRQAWRLDGDGAHVGWPTRVNGPVLSVTAGSPEWRLDDLLPDTNYEFRMRVRSEWSERPWDLGRPMRCATLPLRPRQALLLPLTDAPSNDSFLVLLRLPPDASSTELAIEGAGGTIRRSVEPLDQRERTFTHRVGGLRASTAYLVTATASFADRRERGRRDRLR